MSSTCLISSQCTGSKTMAGIPSSTSTSVVGKESTFTKLICMRRLSWVTTLTHTLYTHGDHMSYVTGEGQGTGRGFCVFWEQASFLSLCPPPTLKSLHACMLACLPPSLHKRQGRVLIILVSCPKGPPESQQPTGQR